MGLRDTFRTAAVAAQAAFGDVFASVRYQQQTSVVYDVSAGVASVQASSVFTSMVFENYTQREIDNENVLPTDVKATVAQRNLTVSTSPALDDTIILASSSAIYNIVNIDKDPADALWVFQLRKK